VVRMWVRTYTHFGPPSTIAASCLQNTRDRLLGLGNL
jgi:hypothetical protein